MGFKRDAFNEGYNPARMPTPVQISHSQEKPDPRKYKSGIQHQGKNIADQDAQDTSENRTQQTDDDGFI